MTRTAAKELEVQSFAAASPAGHLGAVDDIANAISLLLDPRSQWISGQIIRVNGGIAQTSPP